MNYLLIVLTLLQRSKNVKNSQRWQTNWQTNQPETHLHSVWILSSTNYNFDQDFGSEQALQPRNKGGGNNIDTFCLHNIASNRSPRSIYPPYRMLPPWTEKENGVQLLDRGTRSHDPILSGFFPLQWHRQRVPELGAPPDLDFATTTWRQ